MFNKRGQSTLEYAVIIAAVIAGLVAMQKFMTRSVQGKLRDSVNDIGEQYSADHTVSETTIDYSETKENRETFGYNLDTSSGEVGIDNIGKQGYYLVTPSTTETYTSETIDDFGDEKLFEEEE
ncbi:MAG: hypothetical protein P9L96_02515 [Candidatus Gygaella obscura]|nr:hypothetical protein [Candidatus Gygaella obscura]